MRSVIRACDMSLELGHELVELLLGQIRGQKAFAELRAIFTQLARPGTDVDDSSIVLEQGK